jgi:uncharacterized membrane protein
MRVAASTTVAAPADAVWSVIADPARYLGMFSGVTRWEVAGGAPASGLGARYRTLVRVGAAEVGGLVEVVEWTPERELAWHSVTGVDQRGRWRLRPAERPGITRVELRIAYGVAGSGIPGWIAERMSAPTVSRHLQRTLRQLKREVEHEQLRQRAARRRAAV